jgi:hypothetical protein
VRYVEAEFREKLSQFFLVEFAVAILVYLPKKLVESVNISRDRRYDPDAGCICSRVWVADEQLEGSRAEGARSGRTIIVQALSVFLMSLVGPLFAWVEQGLG